jgi:hypothetical protein
MSPVLESSTPVAHARQISVSIVASRHASPLDLRSSSHSCAGVIPCSLEIHSKCTLPSLETVLKPGFRPTRRRDRRPIGLDGRPPNGTRPARITDVAEPIRSSHEIENLLHPTMLQ